MRAATSRIVTLVVHGTFATEGKWWRLGSQGEPTFADRLEHQLSHRGLSGTVWKPALVEGFDYQAFAWSGQNRHPDRLRGGSKLSSTLNQLAQRTRATRNEPLTVNFVAHSHGGNVVLEALRYLKPNVRVGRIALLGTPLITVKPAFRIARFVFSAVLLTFFLVGIFVVISQLGSLVFTGHFWDAAPSIERDGQVTREGFKGSFYMMILLPVLIGYGWLFWLFGNLLDVAWRVVCRLSHPLAWLRGKSRALVYGPSPRKLAASLGGAPILLLSAHNDEADLLLQVGSCPFRLYREYVATQFSKLGRILEIVLVRPFVLGIFLKAVETLLEVFSFGFSIWRSLFLDFEVAPLAERPYYSSHLLVQQRIDVRPEQVRATATLAVEAPSSWTQRSVAARARGLRLSLEEVVEDIKRQIQLRHSTYYEDPAVIDRVADFLTGREAGVVGEAKPSSLLKPSDNFWEALLVGNIALAALYAWIGGTSLQNPVVPYFVALAGYMLPLATQGIVVSFSWAVQRRRPRRPWRWFWVIWAAWGGLFLFSVLMIRLGPGLSGF